jgi:L-lactate dehydrogenase complex protein LldE
VRQQKSASATPPNFSPAFGLPRFSRYNPPMNVSLFVTCLTDLFAPQVGMATVKVLEHFGCKVDFPEAQTCCGQPQYNNGYPGEARALAERMIRVFKDSQYVVTPSGSCCAMIREHYPLLFKDDKKWETEALEFVAKTYEFVEFVTKILKVDVSALTLPQQTAITYHYTCHTRGLHMNEGPCVSMVKQLGNATFVPLEKYDQCCGFGGTFAVKYTDISAAIVKDKVACGNKTHADVMIVNDAGCAMNIGGACHRYGAGFKPVHVAELLADAIANQIMPVGAQDPALSPSPQVNA